MRSFDMGIARKWALEMHAALLEEGDTAVDATMGNGHDTAALCRLVGGTGRVYAFDVQPEALISTRALLERDGLAPQAQLILAGHERMAEFVPAGVHLVVFNLGWLPGVEHAVTTRAETTLAAVEQALELLCPGGLLTVCVYPGHAEGARELAALLDWAAALDPARFDAVVRRYANQPADPPVLIAVQRALRPRKPRG